MKLVRMKKQRGATLLEVLAFLGIASVITVGAVSAFRSAQSVYHAQAIMAQLNAFRSGVKTLYAGQGDYGNLSNINSQIIAAKIVPDSMRVMGTNILPGIGGSPFSLPYVIVSTIPQRVSIMYYNVPTHLCIKAAAMTGRSWESLTINYGGAYPGGFITPSMAAALCTWGDMNHMWWQTM